jgi:competence protein ComGC
MKKIILSLCFLFAITTMVSAQRAAERKEEINKGLKEEVKLTDEQIASVVAIEDEYRPKLKAIKTDAALSDEDKKAKAKVLNEEKETKIVALLGKEKTAQVKTFYSSLKKGDKGAKKEGKKE